MSIPHLVTFAPTDRFYFGGPSGFGDGFFARSERFPAPTTVMGALRAALLVGAGHLMRHRRGRFVPPERKAAARELAGTSRLNHLEETPDFGIIDRISPVFLTRRESDGNFADAWFPCPADVVRSEKTGYRIPKYEETPAKVRNCGRGMDTLFRSDRDWKAEGNGDLIGGAAFWRAWAAGESIETGIVDLADEKSSPFIQRQQTGIGLERRRVAEGRFYVKRDFSMRKGWAFGVFVWFRRTPVLPGTIVLGGDQSVFRLECVPPDGEGGPFADHPAVRSLPGEAGASGTRIAALSQLLVDADHPLLDRSRHSAIPKIDGVRMLRSFRVPKSGTDAPDEPQVRDGRKLLKSDAYRVLPAGSVFRMGEPCGPDIAGGSELARRLGFNRVFLGRESAAD
jgi:hypothetical protein